jgi:hypothetical protein
LVLLFVIPLVVKFYNSPKEVFVLGRPYFSEWVVMLDGASGFGETGEAIAVNMSYSQSVMILWGKGTTGGEVTVEVSDSKDFDGTWAELQRLAWSGDNKQDLYEHDGPCRFIRTRITKAVTGGKVTTKLQCMVG